MSAKGSTFKEDDRALPLQKLLLHAIAQVGQWGDDLLRNNLFNQAAIDKCSLGPKKIEIKTKIEVKQCSYNQIN